MLMTRSKMMFIQNQWVGYRIDYMINMIKSDLLYIYKGCVPSFVPGATKLETIMSESSMDANTPEVNRKQESLKSSDSSLGSLLDEYNDEDLEKTNATLGSFHQSISLIPITLSS